MTACCVQFLSLAFGAICCKNHSKNYLLEALNSGVVMLMLCCFVLFTAAILISLCLLSVISDAYLHPQ